MHRLLNIASTAKRAAVLVNFYLLLLFNIWRNKSLVQTHFYFERNVKAQWVVV